MARVLVIDDEPWIRTTARIHLEPYGHEVILGDDGIQGMDMARRFRPDVIVLDLLMPIVNGHEVLELLRKDHLTADIPVLVITAVTQREVHDRCLEEGARRVLTKPIAPEVLAAAIDEATGAA
jgi:CheY-like chemotaxis protein